MDVGEIVKDSLRYPFLDLKKFFLFGVLVLMGFILVKFAHDFVILGLLFLILGFAFQILDYGYCFRIIKSSINGVMEPPKLNAWKNMFKDGFGLFVIFFVYFLPAGFITILTGIIPSFSYGIVLAILYMIVMLPIIAAEVVQIANTKIKSSMFNYPEIFNMIKTLGWNKFIKWYLTTGVIFVLILAAGYLIVPIIEKVTFSLLGIVIFYFLIVTYLSMYLSRSVALIFKT